MRTKFAVYSFTSDQKIKLPTGWLDTFVDQVVAMDIDPIDKFVVRARLAGWMQTPHAEIRAKLDRAAGSIMEITF